MSYRALYRTYRPTAFEEIAGQQHIVKTLKNALKENKIVHAYLFCGPRGTGKTTMARLLAKALNCEEGFSHQCNHCSNCLSINEGSHPDVIEIDAASNRGIDEVRDLITKVKYAPIKGKYKVYIIDEVHMMTSEAFNALLKTLEEPPQNVIFILATTEPYKLMPTILSRCQRYDFEKVSEEDLFKHLSHVCQEEKINAEPESLKLIISLADGGVRDSLSMLDQAMAYSDNQIKAVDIQDLYGIASFQDRLDLIKAIAKQDVLSLNELGDKLILKGIDIKRLTYDLLDVFKELLLYKTTGSKAMLKVLKDADLSSIDISTATIVKMIDTLLETVSSFKFVSNLRSLFEICLLKLVSCQTLSSSPKEEKQAEAAPKVFKEKIAPVETKKESIVPKPVVIDAITKTIPELTDASDAYVYQEDDIINIMVQATKMDKKTFLDSFTEAKLQEYAFDPKLGSYVAVFNQCQPRIVAKKAVVFESNFKNIISKINSRSNQAGFSNFIKLLTNQDIIVICISHEDYLNYVKKFTNLQQANKLPEPRPITFISASSNKNANVQSATEKFANTLFKED